jgi:uncharacterized protein YndB with AHSA1/START domain
MGRTDRSETFAAAPPEVVWTALTDPNRVVRWLPPEGMTINLEAWDARAGGQLRLVLTCRDPSGASGKTTADSDAISGRFIEAEAPRRLAWATRFDASGEDFGGEMTMVWTLDPEAEGTRIHVEAGNVPPGIRAEDHADGLSASLRQLAREAAGY